MFHFVAFCFVLGLFYETFVTLMAITDNSVFYALWQFTFRKQLESLHQELNVHDELGIPTGFEGMPFDEFCLTVYEVRPDLIDYSQN